MSNDFYGNSRIYGVSLTIRADGRSFAILETNEFSIVSLFRLQQHRYFREQRQMGKSLAALNNSYIGPEFF